MAMETIWIRQCPQCGNHIQYKTIGGFQNAERKESKCLSCGIRYGKKSDRKGEKNPFFGKKHTDKAKKSIGAANTGLVRTDEVCKRQSERNTGSGNPFWGRKHTSETIAKIQRGDQSIRQTDAYRQRASRQCVGSGNPMYGRRVYDGWLKRYGQDEANRREVEKFRKASGKLVGAGNPMYGKPAPLGAGLGWKGWYKGWFFRSLKELSYMINVLERGGHQWRSAEAKDLVIRFVNWDGHKRTYRADFFVDGKRLVEVKPKKLMNTPTNLAKKQAAIEFCNAHGYEYVVEDAVPLLSGEILRMWREKVLVFQDRYDAMFRGRYLV